MNRRWDWTVITAWVGLLSFCAAVWAGLVLVIARHIG